jgi:hypothetical protein
VSDDFSAKQKTTGRRSVVIPMIFYPETGPQCPALPAGQACIIGVGTEGRLAEAVFSGFCDFLPCSWYPHWAFGAYRYLAGAPIVQAAGLNIGIGIFDASDGPLDRNPVGSDSGGGGSGFTCGAEAGSGTITGAGAC